MKSLLMSLTLLLVSTTLAAQNPDSLRMLGNRAYSSRDFANAANFYVETTKTEGAQSTDYYNAACSFALADNSEMALNYLDSAFLYGFGSIPQALADPDLASIRGSSHFQKIIDRENKFLTGEVIQMKDILRALTERKVVVLLDKRIENEYGDWLDFDLGNFQMRRMLEENAHLNLELTSDSLIDFSDRKLFIYNCYGDIHLQNLKLNQLRIRSDDSQRIRNENNLNSQDIVQLNRIQTNSIDFIVNGYNYFRMAELKAEHTDAFGFVNVEVLAMRRSEIILNRRFFGVGEYATGLAIGTLEKPIQQISFRGNTLRTTKEYPSVIPFLVNARQVYFQDNIVEDEFTFDQSAISRLTLTGNVFKRAVDISDASITDPDLYLPFDQFMEGFGNQDNVRPWEVVKNKILITGEANELDDREAYDKLIFTYKKMFDNYRLRGDLNSANACYLKLKDIMIARDYRDFQKERSFKLWVRYQIGVLLKIYTESGTSPAKAIVMSFYIILFFSILYLFFPSEWDPISKSKLIGQFRILIGDNSHGYFKPFIALMYGLAISWVNAFALSLNAFVTLGFGSIPTTGAGRYICILQGFIGWFLLSIFTVALLNQVLP